MEPDEAADLLGDLPEHRKEDLLEHMEDEEAAEVEELLEYDDLVAGGLMTNAYVAVPEGLTVAQALERLRQEAAEVEHVHYVTSATRRSGLSASPRRSEERRVGKGW